MKAVLLTHAWLDNPLLGYRGDDGECRRVERFLHHYNSTWPVVLVDNGSAAETCARLSDKHSINVINAQPNFPRGPGNDYANVWRVYWYIKEALMEYEKVIFLATDAYILSQRLVDYIEAIDKGWTALWCFKYAYPATEISVITRECAAFEEFFAGDCDPFKYNGEMEERTVPLTHVEKGFFGDRYGEWPPYRPYSPEMDYYNQVPDDLDFDDSPFPVLRRVNDKVVAIKP